VFAVLLLAFALTYYFAPNLEKREWHWITPGAVTGILLLIAISRGLRIYLYYFPTYNSTYGSLGAVIVLLLFFYLSGVAVLSGAALNAVVQAFHVRGTAGHAPPEGGVVQRAS
jgi:membrane protein